MEVAFCRLDSWKCLGGRFGVEAAREMPKGDENNAASTRGTP